MKNPYSKLYNPNGAYPVFDSAVDSIVGSSREVIGARRPASLLISSNPLVEPYSIVQFYSSLSDLQDLFYLTQQRTPAAASNSCKCFLLSPPRHSPSNVLSLSPVPISHQSLLSLLALAVAKKFLSHAFRAVSDRPVPVLKKGSDNWS
ncbi:hypothetical protein MUK42_18977 [Musa troglodytarum]|uniref:Uncharacterized protein n=1 Tax=Musa troglodytarum TaxID=320322 RepID=A0A9E7G3X0_9LILI|nr:hypothetical protein MUK42_18977 [Musa troglodytarum]